MPSRWSGGMPPRKLEFFLRCSEIDSGELSPLLHMFKPLHAGHKHAISCRSRAVGMLIKIIIRTLLINLFCTEIKCGRSS